jgi:hypothetical protein
VNRKDLLDSLQDEPGTLRRRLVMPGLLTEILAESEIEPILVGGAALEFYTAGGYATKDGDLALPTAPEVDAAFQQLGFERQGPVLGSRGARSPIRGSGSGGIARRRRAENRGRD